VVPSPTSDDDPVNGQAEAAVVERGSEESFARSGPGEVQVDSASSVGRKASRSPFRAMASLALVVLAIGLLLHEGPRRVGIPIDTQVLVQGMTGNVRCVRDGVWVGCVAHLAETDPTLVLSKFPLQQSVPAGVFYAMGLREAANIHALIWLNIAAVTTLLVALVAMIYRRYGLPIAVLFALLSVPGLLIPYAFQSFGEPLAAVVMAGICVCGLSHERFWPWLAPLAALAAMGKESLLPAILLFGLGSILLGGGSLLAKRRSALTLVAGMAVGLIATVAYNLFRFGGLFNDAYMSEPRASTNHVPINALGLLFSPNGGISWYWPGVAIALVVLVWAVAKPLQTERRDGRRLGGAMILAGFGMGLAAASVWWTPFGGYSYGTRLLLPVGLPVIISAVAIIARRPPETNWLLVRGGSALALMASFVLLPIVGVVFAPESDGHHISQHLAMRPDCAGGPPGLTIDQWENCETAWVWSTEHVTMAQNIPRTFKGNESYWICVVSAIAAVWLAVTAFRRHCASCREISVSARHADVTNLDAKVRFEVSAEDG
jgi:hypothetical protein